jgi:hypothetical protein
MTHERSWGQLADELEGLKAVEPLRAQWHAYVGSENHGIWILRPDRGRAEQVHASFTLIAVHIIEKLGIPPIPVPKSVEHCPHWAEYCGAEEEIARRAGRVRDLSDAVPYGLDTIDWDAVDPCTRAFLEVLRRESRAFRIKSNGTEGFKGKTYPTVSGSIDDLCGAAAAYCKRRARDEIGAHLGRRLENDGTAACSVDHGSEQATASVLQDTKLMSVEIDPSGVDPTDPPKITFVLGGIPSSFKAGVPGLKQQFEFSSKALPDGPDELKREVGNLAHTAITALTRGSSVPQSKPEDWLDRLKQFDYDIESMEQLLIASEQHLDALVLNALAVGNREQSLLLKEIETRFSELRAQFFKLPDSGAHHLHEPVSSPAGTEETSAPCELVVAPGDPEKSNLTEPHPAALSDGFDFATEAGRIEAVAAYTKRWTCSEASLARTARVDPGDLSKWKKDLLPTESNKKRRIEDAIKNNERPTPATKKSPDS